MPITTKDFEPDGSWYIADGYCTADAKLTNDETEVPVRRMVERAGMSLAKLQKSMSQILKGKAVQLPPEWDLPEVEAAVEEEYTDDEDDDQDSAKEDEVVQDCEKMLTTTVEEAEPPAPEQKMPGAKPKKAAAPRPPPLAIQDAPRTPKKGPKGQKEVALPPPKTSTPKQNQKQAIVAAKKLVTAGRVPVPPPAKRLRN